MCYIKAIGFLWAIFFAVFLTGDVVAQDTPSNDAETHAVDESQFLSNVRQLTYDGKRAGEGYFSEDGNALIFQSERDSDNPFYQIYLFRPADRRYASRLNGCGEDDVCVFPSGDG